MKNIPKQPAPKQAIQSSIKVGELFIRYTLQKDIAKVYFKDTPFPRIPLADLDVYFHHLKDNGFIEKQTKARQTTIPIYKCLKTWSSNDRPPMNTLKTCQEAKP